MNHLFKTLVILVMFPLSITLFQSCEHVMAIEPQREGSPAFVIYDNCDLTIYDGTEIYKIDLGLLNYSVDLTAPCELTNVCIGYDDRIYFTSYGTNTSYIHSVNFNGTNLIMLHENPDFGNGGGLSVQ